MSARHFSFQSADGKTISGVLDVSDEADLHIEVGGKMILFSFSEMFGPLPMTKDGRERNLRPLRPFLRAVSLWCVQGKRIENGVAIWHEPRKPVLKHIGGRNYLVIKDGEPGHDW